MTDCKDAARRAIRGLWKYRSAHNLLGNHIDVATGVWTVTDSGMTIIFSFYFGLVAIARLTLFIFYATFVLIVAGIGSNADSFYEYLLKAAVFFADDEYLEIFLRVLHLSATQRGAGLLSTAQAYEAVMSDVFKYPWYVDVHMHQRIIVWPLFTSLQAFWPGLQVYCFCFLSSLPSSAHCLTAVSSFSSSMLSFY